MANEKENKVNHNIVVEKFNFIDGKPTLKAYANVTVDGIVRIYGVKVSATKADATLYVAMPQHKGTGANGDKWYDTVQLANDEFKTAFQAAVLDQYHAALKDRK